MNVVWPRVKCYFNGTKDKFILHMEILQKGFCPVNQEHRCQIKTFNAIMWCSLFGGKASKAKTAWEMMIFHHYSSDIDFPSLQHLRSIWQIVDEKFWLICPIAETLPLPIFFGILFNSIDGMKNWLDFWRVENIQSIYMVFSYGRKRFGSIKQWFWPFRWYTSRWSNQFHLAAICKSLWWVSFGNTQVAL